MKPLIKLKCKCLKFDSFHFSKINFIECSFNVTFIKGVYIKLNSFVACPNNSKVK